MLQKRHSFFDGMDRIYYIYNLYTSLQIQQNTHTQKKSIILYSNIQKKNVTTKYDHSTLTKFLHFARKFLTLSLQWNACKLKINRKLNKTFSCREYIINRNCLHKNRSYILSTTWLITLPAITTRQLKQLKLGWFLAKHSGCCFM